VNLAVALSQRGLRVGLLDADIYGPSIPKMMNLNGVQADISDETDKFQPISNYGVECMSMGLLIRDPTQALVWRGPMLQKSLHQLLFQVEWRDRDVLVVDMPPGTGDVGMTIGQSVANISGALIVTTPQ
jgi:ATP-binding protein involved in chromosome partitioning